jgi:hypothetical protein
MLKYAFLVFLFFSLATELSAQTLGEHWETEVKFRQTGMLVLGSWAVGNIATGLILRGRTDGSTKYFHEMNAIWNSVNLGIAAFGYFSAARMAAPSSAFEMYGMQMGLDKTLLFNAGLDLAYVAGGFWLMERSKNTDKRPERLKGYGQSVVLQGAFLFVFDIALYALHQKIKVPEGLSLNIRPGAPDFMSLSLVF